MNINEEDDKIPDPVYHTTDNYNTAYFGKVPDDVAAKIPAKYDIKLISTLVSQLNDRENPGTKDEVLRVLKEGSSQDLLVEAIGKKEFAKDQRTLIAACWECGLDFSIYLSFFVELAVNGDYNTCIEAMTVITENMAGPFTENELVISKKLMELQSDANDARKPLFDLINARLMA